MATGFDTSAGENLFQVETENLSKTLVNEQNIKVK